MKQILLTLLAATLLLGSCNRDNDITTQPAPVIELDSQSGIYTVKAGSSLTIAPTVRYNEGATYQWSIDGRTVSDQPTYTAVWPEAGSFYVTFRVTTASGSDSEEIRVDVGALAPPVISLAIPENNSVMFGSLAGSTLGIWVAHGEGKFSLPYAPSHYHVVARYAYDAYPANPNGSPEAIAGLVSADGRHLAMMPHLERAIFPWQCAWYPEDRRLWDEVTPWIEAFVNARKWVEKHQAGK